MASRLLLLDTAKAELEAIVAYLMTASGSPIPAKKFVDEFQNKINLAREQPELFGLSRIPELANLGYRTLLVGNYVVIYTYRDDALIVAHVFHQRQDYGNLI